MLPGYWPHDVQFSSLMLKVALVLSCPQHLSFKTASMGPMPNKPPCEPYLSQPNVTPDHCYVGKGMVG